MTYQAPGYAPDRGSIQTSAIILIVVGFLCGGLVPAIFGIISLTQIDTNPQSARQMNKIGWIIFWVLLGLGILLVVGYFVLMFLVFGVLAMPAIMGG